MSNPSQSSQSDFDKRLSRPEPIEAEVRRIMPEKSRVERMARRAIWRWRWGLRVRGRRGFHGPWWRHQLFDPVRLAQARDMEYRCCVCGSVDIVRHVGPPWSEPVAWVCAKEHPERGLLFSPEMAWRSLPAYQRDVYAKGMHGGRSDAQ